MNRFSTYFPLIIAGLLAAASFWLEHVVRNEYPGGLGNARHDPDVIVSTIVADRFNAEGRRISRISASEVRHFPDDDTAELTAPVLTLTRDDRPIVFTSRTGHADDKGKTVTMAGNVRGQRAASATAAAQTLETEELTVLADDEIARTPRTFIMTQGNATLTGKGAEWNNITGLFTAGGHVRSVIPASRKPAPAQ